MHVDVAVYAKEDENYFLAKAKEFSAPENRCWEEADPKVLKEKINSHVADSDDRKQFRRCIRYLKDGKITILTKNINQQELDLQLM